MFTVSCAGLRSVFGAGGRLDWTRYRTLSNKVKYLSSACPPLPHEAREHSGHSHEAAEEEGALVATL